MFNPKNNSKKSAATRIMAAIPYIFLGVHLIMGSILTVFYEKLMSFHHLILVYPKIQAYS